MKIFKQKAGVISRKAVWVCIDDCWLYIGDSLLDLFLDMIRGWRRDTHLSM